MKIKFAAQLTFIALTMAVQADSISLFNTGVNGAGATLPDSSPDPHWTVISGPGISLAQPAVVLFGQSGYPQSGNSAWIWVTDDGAAGINSPYTFRLTFDLTGYDSSTAVINGQWAVDNMGSIFLNGSNSGIGSGTLSLLGPVDISNFTMFHSFTINSGFNPGINTLDFVATDTGNPGRLNVASLQGTVTPVPEPASVVLILSSCGLVLLGSFGRQSDVSKKHEIV